MYKFEDLNPINYIVIYPILRDFRAEEKWKFLEVLFIFFGFEAYWGKINHFFLKFV